MWLDSCGSSKTHASILEQRHSAAALTEAMLISLHFIHDKFQRLFSPLGTCHMTLQQHLARNMCGLVPNRVLDACPKSAVGKGKRHQD